MKLLPSTMTVYIVHLIILHLMKFTVVVHSYSSEHLVLGANNIKLKPLFISCSVVKVAQEEG